MPITDRGILSITPDDIKVAGHLFDAFQHYETEVSAQWLVRFAQARGEGWKPFTFAQIEAFYNEGGRRYFTFNNLLAQGMILEPPSRGEYHFTEVFIARCYRASVR